MLKSINNCGLSDTDKLAASMLRGWCAVEVETGAHLRQTRGRGKGGLGTFVLVVPEAGVKTDEILKVGGAELLFTARRKVVRAWTEPEAIEAANVRLEKMRARREVVRPSISA